MTLDTQNQYSKTGEYLYIFVRALNMAIDAH